MSVSFFAVAINAYMSPIMIMNSEDGRCHMGIPGKASIPFMSVDVLVEIVLTGVFIYLLQPTVKTGWLSKVSGDFRATKTSKPTMEENTYITAAQRNIINLLRKSLVGSLLIMIPTMVNMIQLYIMQGRELALVCVTMCILDGRLLLLPSQLMP